MILLIEVCVAANHRGHSSSAPSGGTLATIFSILEVYNVKQLAEAFKPWVLSPIPRRAKSPSPFGVLGVGSHPDLGIMTKSIAANCDRAIVQRSWGLIEEGKLYGENFDFSEHMHVKSWALGYAISVALAFGMVALAISPFRWLAKKFVYGPGEGRTKEYVLISLTPGELYSNNGTGRRRKKALNIEPLAIQTWNPPRRSALCLLSSGLEAYIN